MICANEAGAARTHWRAFAKCGRPEERRRYCEEPKTCKFACGDEGCRCHALEPYPELAVWQAKVLSKPREPSKFRILGAVGVRIFDARPCTFPILCAREFKEISEQAPEQARATRCTCEMKNEYAHEG